jgi:hypothetical protein
MKNNTTNNVRSLLRNVLTPAAFACMLIAASVPSTAHAGEPRKVGQLQAPVQIKYMGKINSQPVYEVNVDNLQEEDIYLTLRDESGSLLYSDTFKGKKFSQKFQFNVADAENMKITLGLTSKKDKKTQVLQFNNVTKTYEDVVITKIY